MEQPLCFCLITLIVFGDTTMLTKAVFVELRIHKNRRKAIQFILRFELY